MAGMKISCRGVRVGVLVDVAVGGSITAGFGVPVAVGASVAIAVGTGVLTGVGNTATTDIVNVFDSASHTLSDATTVNVNVPCSLGVPSIIPEELNASPGGSAPEASVNVFEPVPPLTPIFAR
jgi:hypothetical protein